MYASFPKVSADELPFLRQILFDVDDDAPRMIYADWLDEREDPRGQFLRLDLMHSRTDESDLKFDQLDHRRRELVAGLDPQWVCLVARSPIERCPQVVDFKFLCPGTWQNLKPFGDDQSVRYCDQCGKSVTYCFTIDAARKNARFGQCVAVDASVHRKTNDLLTLDAGYDLMGLLDDGNRH